jgi:hypothetical protein
MGGTCAKMQDEEETINNIFSQMTLAEIDSSVAYEEFVKCIKDGKLDFFLFPSYISSITGYNNYQELQNNFLENLRKDNNAIRKIGSLVIYHSKGSPLDKVKILRKHFKTFYQGELEDMTKIYISDIIELNTDHCYETFSKKIGDENMKTLSKIWTAKRKSKLINFIHQNYESTKFKYLKRGSKDDILDVDLPPLNEITNLTVIDEFIDLTYMQLTGEYIREWLYQDFMKEHDYKCY